MVNQGFMLMIQFDEALKIIDKNVQTIKKADLIPIEECRSRVLDKDYQSKFNSPKFHKASMDGIVILKEDYFTQKEFRVSGEIKAGSKVLKELSNGEAKLIYTGGIIPGEKKKLVVIMEDCIFSNNKVKFKKDNTKINNIRNKGCDFKQGTVCLKKNSALSARSISLASSMNLKKLKVRSKPKIAIIITGDEIRSKNNPNGEVLSSNTVILTQLISLFGGTVTQIKISEDSKEKMIKNFKSLKDFDLLVTTGGLSVGKYDLVKTSLKKIGLDYLFEKILMKPGKPITFGKFKKNKFFLGLPGNPVSCYIGAIFFLKSIINKFLGYNFKYLNSVSAISLNEIPKNNQLTSINRLLITRKKKRSYFKFFQNQDSSLQSILNAANGVIIRKPFSKKINKGEVHEIFEFNDI